jgi:hypothetical protein
MIKRIAAEVFTAASLFGGLAALSYGAYLAWHPLGYIIPGAAFFALGLLAELRT